MSVPEGWNRTTLSEAICRIQAGFSAHGEQRLLGPGELGVLRTGAVLGGAFDPTAYKVVTHQSDRLKVSVKANTVLLGRKNSAEMVGAAVFVDRDHAQLYLSDLIWELTASPAADARWLTYALQNESTSARIRLAATGTQSTMKNLSRSDFLRIPIDLPPLAEQKKIAEILHTWDDAIEISERLRRQTTHVREWLRSTVLSGVIRLSGHATPWQSAVLGHWLSERKSRSSGTEEVFSVSVRKGLINQIQHLGRSVAAVNTSRYNLVAPGDVVYTKSPTGDFPFGIVKQSRADKEVVVSPLYGVFQPQTTAIGTLLDAIFESPTAAQNYLTPLVQKGAKNTISITNPRFLEGTIRLPVDPAEQRTLAKLMEDSSHEIDFIDRQIDLLRQQKRGLMQKLLTGEVRVTGAEVPNVAQ